jgi:hypothetical protein
MKHLILLSLVLACCGLVGCGSMYAVHYSALSAEARAALAKKVSEEPALLGKVMYQKNSVILQCRAKEKDTPEFQAKRKEVERVLGPELMKMLFVYSERHGDA